MAPDPHLTAVQAYFSEVRAIHASGAGVAETSYYPPLSALLNALGSALKPKVRAIIHLQNRGAGIPDGGLFDAAQFQKGEGNEIQQGQLPSRGALEVKAPAEQVSDIATGKQVGKYLNLYGLVLVTNMRAFALYDLHNGQPRMLEAYEIAPSAPVFWSVLANPAALTAQHAAPLAEFLTRALQANAPLTTPESVAWFLASYAREARHRLDKTPLVSLAPLRSALSEALDLNFTGDQGERFFRATLVQTLWYGMFSAWVLHTAKPDATPFDWRTAAWELHLPVMQRLFGDLAGPSAQQSLHLTDLLDRTAATLNRVRIEEFNARFQVADAVQYFYEPFLAAYDPELRKQFGVWYTPTEVVHYMVERVDRALRTELGLPLGLADPNVFVLDPATGTGSYLTATLERIYATLSVNADDALADDLRDAVTRRLIGFEIMPAPYVIAHMRLSQQLAKYGAPLRDEYAPDLPAQADGTRRAERAAVYLTNALTNWTETPPRLNYAELQAEQDAAQHVKQTDPILVVMGNPPYGVFSGVAQKEEGGLIAKYKEGLVSIWGIGRFNLDELYVRFFRVAERKIAEGGRGIVSFISPSSFLSDPSFLVMRRTFLEEFDLLSFDNLNGDSRETGKLTPDGMPDPSIFSTPMNRAGIKSGTAISLLVRRGARENGHAPPQVQYRDFWGRGKREALLTSLEGGGPAYSFAQPIEENRFLFKPDQRSDEYQSWPSVMELASVAPFNGPIERRGMALISVDKDDKFQRVRDYLDPSKTDDEVALIEPRFMRSSGEFNSIKARNTIVRTRKSKAIFDSSRIVKYPFKPMDVRLAYLSADIAPLFSRPAPDLLHQKAVHNSFFITRDSAANTAEGKPVYFSQNICDYDLLTGHARHFPIWHVVPAPPQGDNVLLAAPTTTTIRANLSSQARAYLAFLGAPDPDADWDTAALLWHHALAVGFSNEYLSQHAGGIAQDWPRVPLPDTLEVLRASAGIGAQVAALLDDKDAVIPLEAAAAGRLTRTNPARAAALGFEVRAGWGVLQRGNVVMPGRGKVVARASDEEQDERLAGQVVDVILNDGWSWTGIPQAAWDYTVGGYQVMKKWLSYREFGVLGRALTVAEAREFSGIARRLSALVLLESEMDANYQNVRNRTLDWRAF